MDNKKIETYNQKFKNASPQEVLAYFIREFSGQIVFSTSLGAEDQVITHMIAEIDKNTDIFMLDTGRHFEETYDVYDRTCARYDMKIKLFFPNQSEVEDMVNEKGSNLFYDSVENRKRCCEVRKITGLKRALKPFDIWITGLRQAQAVTRKNMDRLEWDYNLHVLKLNPLIDWSEQDVWDFIKSNNVPYNRLHDKGFPSIGCEPCTRAIEKGEDVRAGRWWWENPETKECGLHKK